MNYPVKPTVFAPGLFEDSLYERDFFYCKVGAAEYPDHHCKVAYNLSVPFIKSYRTAIDIGCRDGEYTRYLTRDFENVFAFDPRTRKFFPHNVDVTKVTHFGVPLGDKPISERKGNGPIKNENFARLDDFKFEDVDYIKIDTDGYEMAVLNGARQTIEKYWPVINLEVYFERETLEWIQEEWNYKIVAVCPRGYDHILVRE
jgi:hypothetical protein